MSGFPAESPDVFNLREVLVDIDRRRKETLKCMDEQNRLSMQAARSSRDGFVVTFALMIASMGVGAALFGAGMIFCRMLEG